MSHYIWTGLTLQSQFWLLCCFCLCIFNRSSIQCRVWACTLYSFVSSCLHCLFSEIFQLETWMLALSTKIARPQLTKILIHCLLYTIQKKSFIEKLVPTIEITLFPCNSSNRSGKNMNSSYLFIVSKTDSCISSLRNRGKALRCS